MSNSIFNTKILVWLSVAAILNACGSSSEDSGQLQDPLGIEPEQTTNDPIDTDTDSGTDTDSENNTAVEPQLPPITAGSDLERLVSGLERIASSLLLDLNQKIVSGETLTDQENDCLGSFEPGMGESLAAIECPASPLFATIENQNVRVSVTNASFYNTAICQASLFSNNSDDCNLQSAMVNVSVEWVVGEFPARPFPIAGADIRYAIDNNLLSLKRNDESAQVLFGCEIDLNTALPLTAMNDCEDVVPAIADRLDVLLP